MNVKNQAEKLKTFLIQEIAVQGAVSYFPIDTNITLSNDESGLTIVDLISEEVGFDPNPGEFALNIDELNGEEIIFKLICTTDDISPGIYLEAQLSELSLDFLIKIYEIVG